MRRAVILVGTETGTAKDVADGLAEALEGRGVEVEVVDMEDADTGVVQDGRAVVVCTATHGDGELPYNSLDFFEALEEERPDLRDVPYCVCGLGDNAYPGFCQAGRIWSSFLAGLGAREVIERHEIDGLVSDTDVDGACEWVVRAAEKSEELAAERR
ncbi:MAG: flavodoxin domain-containing protein [Rubrobacter sp.]